MPLFRVARCDGCGTSATDGSLSFPKRVTRVFSVANSIFMSWGGCCATRLAYYLPFFRIVVRRLIVSRGAAVIIE